MSSEAIQCYLVGAGPGDPGLLTLRAQEVLAMAEVVVYDSLINEAILDMCSPTCEKVFAGKRAGRHFMSQEQIHSCLLEHLKAGKIVVRLKGGDPFVFARGGEEMEAVDQAGFAFEVIPGVSSGTAVPAYAGIPLTHREWAQTVTFVTAHEKEGADPRVNWQSLAQLEGTLVVFMGAQSLELWSQQLMKHGLQASTPTAFIQWGTRVDQRAVFGTLSNITHLVKEAGLSSPAIVVVGQTVSLRERLSWFEKKPLFGKRVVVTRSRDQNTSLNRRLRELGAHTLEIPTISIHPKPLPETILQQLESTHWLAFSSPNGVEAFFSAFLKQHDIRALSDLRLAAVGSSTADTARQYHVKVDFIPSDFRSEAMAEQWPDLNPEHRILYLCGNLASCQFEDILAAQGLTVDRLDVYETREGVDTESTTAQLFREQGADWVTFCSSSAARAFAAAFPRSEEDVYKVASIGPVTTRELESLGWPCHAQPQTSKLAAMVQAMLRVQG